MKLWFALVFAAMIAPSATGDIFTLVKFRVPPICPEGQKWRRKHCRTVYRRDVDYYYDDTSGPTCHDGGVINIHSWILDNPNAHTYFCQNGYVLEEVQCVPPSENCMGDSEIHTMYVDGRRVDITIRRSKKKMHVISIGVWGIPIAYIAG